LSDRNEKDLSMREASEGYLVMQPHDEKIIMVTAAYASLDIYAFTEGRRRYLMALEAALAPS
jgi:hypothetical protein